MVWNAGIEAAPSGKADPPPDAVEALVRSDNSKGNPPPAAPHAARGAVSAASCSSSGWCKRSRRLKTDRYQDGRRPGPRPVGHDLQQGIRHQLFLL